MPDESVAESIEEAMADVASFSVTITGRNGQSITYNFPAYDYERAEIEQSVNVYRRPLYMEGYATQAGWEPLPYSRVFSFTMRTRLR